LIDLNALPNYWRGLGLRAREAVRESVQEQNAKIHILIGAQIANEGRFAKTSGGSD
jgi:hypothetical protein